MDASNLQKNIKKTLGCLLKYLKHKTYDWALVYFQEDIKNKTKNKSEWTDRSWKETTPQNTNSILSRGHHWPKNGKDFVECLMRRVNVLGL